MMSQQPRRSHFIVVAVDVLQIPARLGVVGIGSVGGGEFFGPFFSLSPTKS